MWKEEEKVCIPRQLSVDEDGKPRPKRGVDNELRCEKLSRIEQRNMPSPSTFNGLIDVSPACLGTGTRTRGHARLSPPLSPYFERAAYDERAVSEVAPSLY